MNVSTYRLGALTLVLTLGLAVVGLTGCDSVNGEAEGRVQLLLTDAPIDEMDSVFVTIDRVVLVGDTSDADGLVLLEDDVTLDLLKFQNGIDTMLVNELVPEGDYTQIRFYVGDETTIYLKDGTEQTLMVPSGFVRINLPEFEIDEDDDVVVIKLDFDVNKSFLKQGNGQYKIKPVIHPIEFTINGEDVDLPDESEE